jgi:LDH2 family malate/lactate/ureidoglycolate dehydrogenase
MSASNTILRPEQARRIVQGILAAHGVPGDEAAIVADVLVRADLRGVESHGVARLEKYYVSRLRMGVVTPVCNARVVRETPVSAVMDAGEGLGHVAAKRAMDLCIGKALVSGMGAVAVNHSNHFGIAGYYAMMALPHDLIGVALTNASCTVAPTYSRQRLLGTNPIAVAVPAGEERPFVLDMATTVAAEGKIEVKDRQGLPLPAGWIIDKEGRPSTVSTDFYDGGALLPLGGDADGASYKGYGLSLLVDILSGVLAGAASSTGVLRSGTGQPKPTGIGHFFAALRIDLFRDPGEFKAAMDHTLRTIRSSPLAPGASRIYIAGEKEWEFEAARQRDGIPYGSVVTEMLRRLAAETGVAWDA